MDNTPLEILSKVDYIENLVEKSVKTRAKQRRQTVYSYFMPEYIRSLYVKHPETVEKHLDKYLEDLLKDCNFLWKNTHLLQKLRKEKAVKLIAECASNPSPEKTQILINYLDIAYQINKEAFYKILPWVISEEQILKYADDDKQFFIILSARKPDLAIRYLDKIIQLKCAYCIERLLPEYEKIISQKNLEEFLYLDEVNENPGFLEKLIKLTLPEKPKEFSRAIIYGYLRFRPDLARKHAHKIKEYLKTHQEDYLIASIAKSYPEFSDSVKIPNISFHILPTKEEDFQSLPDEKKIQKIKENPELIMQVDNQFLAKHIKELAENERTFEETFYRLLYTKYNKLLLDYAKGEYLVKLVKELVFDNPEILKKYDFDDIEFLAYKALYYPEDTKKKLNTLLEKLKKGIIDDESYYAFVALLILKEVHGVKIPELPEPWKSIYELHKRIKQD